MAVANSNASSGVSVYHIDVMIDVLEPLLVELELPGL